MASAIVIRTPTFSKVKTSAGFVAPDLPFLTEKWHVTHSTLPMWKDKRNVAITYEPIASSNAADAQRINDLVSYQGLESTKVSTVKGVDTAATAGSLGEWNWRGSGWLKPITSHWEVIGWGTEEATANKWVVTIFAKTLFTPAGIDVYSKDRTGLSAATIAGIKAGLVGTGDEDVKQMAAELFEVVVNDESKTTKEQ